MYLDPTKYFIDELLLFVDDLRLQSDSESQVLLSELGEEIQRRIKAGTIDDSYEIFF